MFISRLDNQYQDTIDKYAMRINEEFIDNVQDITLKNDSVSDEGEYSSPFELPL